MQAKLAKIFEAAYSMERWLRRKPRRPTRCVSISPASGRGEARRRSRKALPRLRRHSGLLWAGQAQQLDGVRKKRNEQAGTPGASMEAAAAGSRKNRATALCTRSKPVVGRNHAPQLLGPSLRVKLLLAIPQNSL